MANYVLDSFALLAFFRNEAGADRVEELLNNAAEDKHELYTSVVNAGEVYYISHRKDGEAKAMLAWNAMKTMPLHVVDANLDFALEAAKIKAGHKLSYADAFAAALTIQKRATLLTGDNEFDALKGLKGFKVEYIV
jgi:predicted nucleic acid-binding protein